MRLCESPVPEGSGGSGRGRKHCNGLGTLVTKSLAFTGRHLENESRSWIRERRAAWKQRLSQAFSPWSRWKWRVATAKRCWNWSCWWEWSWWTPSRPSCWCCWTGWTLEPWPEGRGQRSLFLTVILIQHIGILLFLLVFVNWCRASLYWDVRQWLVKSSYEASSWTFFSALKLDLMIKRPEAYLALISFFASN